MFESKASGDRGRCLVATELIRRGTVVVAETSKFVVANRLRCHVCLLPGNLRCTSCKAVFYCSASCQRVHWQNSHREQCSFMASTSSARLALSSSTPSHSALQLLQLLTLILPHRNSANIENLAANRDKFDDATIESFGLIIVALVASFESKRPSPSLPQQQDQPLPSPTELMMLLCKISCNALGVTDSDSFTDAGVGLFPTTLSQVNHSCAPNCTVLFDLPTRTARLVALQDIPKSQELTISYVDPADPLTSRQADLLKRYHFECVCRLCTKQSILEYSYACQSTPNCRGLFSIPPPPAHSSPCSQCSAPAPPRDFPPLVTLNTLTRKSFPPISSPLNVENNIENGNINKNNNNNKEEEPLLTLFHLQTRLLPPASPYALRTAQKIYSRALSRNDWSTAFNMGERVLEAMNLVFFDDHVDVSVTRNKAIASQPNKGTLNPAIGLLCLSLCRLGILVVEDLFAEGGDGKGTGLALAMVGKMRDWAERAHFMFSVLLGDAHVLTLEAREKRLQLESFLFLKN